MITNNEENSNLLNKNSFNNNNLQQQNLELMGKNANDNELTIKSDGNMQQERNIFLINNQTTNENPNFNQNIDLNFNNSSNQTYQINKQDNSNHNIYNYQINSNEINQNRKNSLIPNNIPKISVSPIHTYSDSFSYDNEEEEEYLKIIELRNEQQKSIKVPLNDPSLFHIPDLDKLMEENRDNSIKNSLINKENSMKDKNIIDNNEFQSESDTELIKEEKNAMQSKNHQNEENENDFSHSFADDSDSYSYSTNSSLSISQNQIDNNQQISNSLTSHLNKEKGNNQSNIKALNQFDYSIQQEETSKHKKKRKRKQNKSKNQHNSTKLNPKTNTLPLVYTEELNHEMDSSSTQSSSVTSSDDDYASPYWQNSTEYVDIKKFFTFRIPEIPHVTNETFDNEIDEFNDLNELIAAIKK